MKYQMILPAIIAFIISVVMCPIFIPFLKRLKFGQYIRDEGPKWHEGKSGTPTMGGIVILVATAVTAVTPTALLRENDNPWIFIISR